MSAQESALPLNKPEPAKGAQVQEQERKQQQQQQQQNAQSESLNPDVLAQISRILTLVTKSSEGIALSPPPGQFVIGCVLQLLALGVAVAFGIYAVRSVRLASEANLFASQALQEARVANEIAVLSLCAAIQAQDGSLPAICNSSPVVDPSIVPLDVSQLFSGIGTASAPTTSTRGSLFPTIMPSSSVPITSSGQAASTFYPTFSLPSTAPSSASPSQTSGVSSSSSSGPASTAPRGAIIGGVIAGVIVLLLICAFLFCLLRHRRARRRSNLSAPVQAMPIEHAPTVTSDKSSGLLKRRKAYQIFRETFIESKISTGRE